MKKILLAIVFLLLFQYSYSQIDNFIRYGIFDGLAQNQVMWLKQDCKGYIWLSTRGGISRFDGLEFRNFTTQNGLASNFYRWGIGLKNGGILAFTHTELCIIHNDKIQNINIDSLIGDYIPKSPNKIYKAIEDEQLTFWILTNKGICSIKNEKLSFFRFPKPIESGVSCVFYRTNNKIWFGTRNPDALYTYSFNKKEPIDTISHKEMYFYPFDLPLIIVDDSYMSIIKNDTLELFANFPFGNLIKSGENKYVAVRTHKDYYEIIGIENSTFTSIYKTKRRIHVLKCRTNGELVFTTSENEKNLADELSIYNPHTKEIRNQSFQTINTILVDSEDNIWVATENGLFRIVAFNNYTKESGMPSYVWSIAEDRDSSIWFAPFNRNKLSYLRNNKIVEHNTDFDTYFYMGSTFDFNKNLIINTLKGFVVYNGTTFQNYFSEPNAIFYTFSDSVNKKIYMGRYDGLEVYDRNYKLLKSYPEFSFGKTGIILCMVRNQNNEIWYVTGSQLGTLDSISPKVYHKKNTGIIGSQTLYCDNKNNLWMGASNGLFMYDYKTFHRFNHPELRLCSFVTNLDSSRIIIGAARGILTLDLKKFYEQNDTSFSFYGKSQGFLGEECAQNGFLKDSKGNFWVATNTNVVRFRPEDLMGNPYPPQLYITGIKISEDNINWQLLPSPALPYYQKNIHFEFVGINHTAPEKVTYSYKLEGYDKAWSKHDGKREAIYTNLQPGEYTFRIKAFNNNGIENEQPVVYHFRIVPAWWQTFWFQIVAIVSFVILIVIFVIFLMNNYRKKREQKLLAQKQFTELQLANVRSQIYPHFFFNSLSAIQSIIYRDDKELAIKYFGNLSNLVRTSLDDSRRPHKTLKEELAFVENYLKIQKYRFVNRFDYQINIAPTVDDSILIPPMLVQTFAENAVKHGLEPLKSGGCLQINVENIENDIQITLTDNGVGRKKADEVKYKNSGFGFNIIDTSIAAYNQSQTTKINYQIIDLYDNEQKSIGTKAMIRLTKSENKSSE